MNKTILPVVINGWEKLSLRLREEFMVWVFENRILSRIFGDKGDENRKCRRL